MLYPGLLVLRIKLFLNDRSEDSTSVFRFAAYGATKRSVVHLTKSLQASGELHQYIFYISAICIGNILVFLYSFFKHLVRSCIF